MVAVAAARAGQAERPVANRAHIKERSSRGATCRCRRRRPPGFELKAGQVSPSCSALPSGYVSSPWTRFSPRAFRS
jgi:hypothetical protein